MDIIAAIDEATGCQQCGKPLERSVSDDFCGEGCQQAWHANRVALVPQTAPSPEWSLAPGGVIRGHTCHLEIREDGTIMDNTGAILAREARLNIDVGNWIPPLVWDYLREGEGS